MASLAIPRLPLTERLRPSTLGAMVGNARARYELRAWADSWSDGRVPARRAVVLSGPPGVGKTTAALALAAESGWTVVEMNASDARNERAVENVAGRASVSHTLGETWTVKGPRHALILLDEADCLSGRAVEGSRPKPVPPPLVDFLRGRYGTVEALNAAWGLLPKGKPRAFDDWAAVPRSPGNYAWARLPAARRDLDDWRSAGRSTDLSDRGGLGAISRLVRSTHQPIILTVNDDRPLTRYSPVFRTGVVRIRLFPVRDEELSAFVQRVARTERIELYEGAVGSIVRRAHGDVRAALNDLEAVAPLPPGPMQLSVLGFRDLGADFIALTEDALSGSRYFRSVEVQDRLDAPPDDLLPWIEENLPSFAPDPVHRDEGFRVLGVAEQFLARARRARVYGLWSYASELMTGGVSLALRESPGPGGAGVAFPQFLGEMGRTRALRATRDSLARKAGRRFHLSVAKSREVLVPFLERLLAQSTGRGSHADLRRRAAEICQELEFTPEEVALLLRSSPDSRAVQDLVGRSGSKGTEGPEDSGEATDTGRTERPESSEATRPGSPARPIQRRLGDF